MYLVPPQRSCWLHFGFSVLRLDYKNNPAPLVHALVMISCFDCLDSDILRLSCPQATDIGMAHLDVPGGELESPSTKLVPKNL